MKSNIFIIITIAVFFCSACEGGISTPTPDFDATLEVALEQTLTAQPTHTETVVPTQTPTPTFTPTATKEPTATQPPTATEPPKSFSMETQDEGWTQYVYHEDGFAISLPPTWAHLDLAADDIDEMLSVASANNPQMGDVLSSDYLRNLAAIGIKFYAVDSSADSLSAGVPTSMNIMVVDLPFEISFDEYVEVNLQQLRMMMGEDLLIQQERIEISGIEAARIMYEAELNDLFGNPHLVAFQQFLMLKGDKQYVITFGSQSEFMTVNQAFFDDIVQSFKFTQ